MKKVGFPKNKTFCTLRNMKFSKQTLTQSSTLSPASTWFRIVTLCLYFCCSEYFENVCGIKCKILSNIIFLVAQKVRHIEFYRQTKHVYSAKNQKNSVRKWCIKFYEKLNKIKAQSTIHCDITKLIKNTWTEKPASRRLWNSFWLF